MKEYITGFDKKGFFKWDERQELIRCKDCKWYSGHWCYRLDMLNPENILVTPDDYCSRAERKEE